MSQYGVFLSGITLGTDYGARFCGSVLFSGSSHFFFRWRSAFLRESHLSVSESKRSRIFPSVSCGKGVIRRK